MPNAPTDAKLWETLETGKREAVRDALNSYIELLKDMQRTGSAFQRENARVSHTQVESAKRVLWMED